MSNRSQWRIAIYATKENQQLIINWLKEYKNKDIAGEILDCVNTNINYLDYPSNILEFQHDYTAWTEEDDLLVNKLELYCEKHEIEMAFTRIGDSLTDVEEYTTGGVTIGIIHKLGVTETSGDLDEK